MSFALGDFRYRAYTPQGAKSRQARERAWAPGGHRNQLCEPAREAPRVGLVGRPALHSTQVPVNANGLRKSFLGLAIFGAALLAAIPSPASPSDSPPSEASHARAYVVAAIGDSLTDTRVGGGLYMRLLQARCPQSRFDAYGVGGQRTDHMRWRLARDLFGEGAWAVSPRPPYTHMLTLGGVNDLVASPRGYASTQSIRDNLSAMWKVARARGVKVIALDVPPWSTRGAVRDLRLGATRRLNSWILSQPATGTVDAAVDIHARLVGDDGISLRPEFRRFHNDFIHWNRRGHEVVAEELFHDVFSDCQ